MHTMTRDEALEVVGAVMEALGLGGLLKALSKELEQKADYLTEEGKKQLAYFQRHDAIAMAKAADFAHS